MNRGFQKGNSLGKANKGRVRTAVWLERQKAARLGKHYSPKTQFKKGNVSWTKLNGNPAAKNNPQVFKKGQRPHNWAGGISSFRNSVRSSVEYRIWRSDVFSRDDYTCQLCRKKGGSINADHYPLLFSEIMDKFKVETMEQARDCEQLWDIGNGRTLCVECHKLVTKAKKK